MYNKHKLILLFVFIFLYILFYIINVPVSGAYSFLVSVLAIILGFHIAAISAMFGREYTKDLYKQIDKNKKVCTKLEVMKRYFETSIIVCIINLIMVLLDYILEFIVSKNNSRLLNIIFRFETSSIIPMFLINILLMFFVLKILLNGLYDEASKNDN